jgi:hypothetical protein
MMVNIRMVKDMAKAFISKQMVSAMKVHGNTENYNSKNN